MASPTPNRPIAYVLAFADETGKLPPTHSPSKQLSVEVKLLG
jgi:hypothetical protein